MNILLVDDDKFILEGLSRGISWEALPFTGRFEAKNTIQAKAVIEEVDIEVVVCDIEMPGESGLDLLAWIREKNYPIEVVFLTSHPDFEYARRALSLGSFDYLLKPIEYEKLTIVLGSAARKAEENRIRNQYLSYRNSDEVIAREQKAVFFRHLLARYGSLTEDELDADLLQCDLDYGTGDQFVMMVVRFPNVDNLNWRDDGQIYYLLQNAVAKGFNTFQDDKNVTLETIWKENINVWVIVVRCEQASEAIWYTLGKTLSDSRKIFRQHSFEITAYISEVTDLFNLSSQWLNIRQMLFENIAFKSGIFFVNRFEAENEPDELVLDKEEIEKAFYDNDEAKISELIDSFVDEVRRYPASRSRVIQKTVMDWQQIVFHYLEQNQIQAETLYANDEYIELHKRIDLGPEEYGRFLHYLAKAAIDSTKQLKESDNMIFILKRYIDENLSEDLSRTALANVVFLNGDYMATYFKRKVGMSIKKYVFEKRMAKARELLQSTAEPIYSIALKVGYPSASYFTKQFKSFYGKEPNEYRKRP